MTYTMLLSDIHGYVSFMTVGQVDEAWEGYVENLYTGGSCLSQIFWKHENLSSVSVIWLTSTNLH